MFVALNIGNNRFALGQRSCFVKDRDLDFVGNLEAFRVFNQYPVLCAASGAHHDGRRSGKPQRTGAGDDQDGDHIGKCRGKRIQVKPNNECRNGKHKNYGNKIAGYNVRKPLDGRAGALGFRNHFHNPGKHGVRADLRGYKEERAGFVDGCADDCVACFFVDGDGFAGDHGLINTGKSLLDGSVHRDFFARPHADHVANLHLFNRDINLLTVSHDAGCFRLEMQKFFYGITRVGFGLCLKIPAQKNKGNNNCCCIKVSGG